MPARLTVIRGRDIDRVYRIEDTQAAVLGRSVKCDIRVSDSQASRTHCRIQHTGGEWGIADTGSRNGTFVNKERITQAALRSGDLIRVGTTLYEFQVEGEAPDNLAGGTDVFVEPEESNLDVFIEPDEAAPLQSRGVPAQERVCSQCGHRLDGNAAAESKATNIGGRLYCSRCVVQHSDGEADAKPIKPERMTESSEMQSLLQSLERAAEADRADGFRPPPAPPPPSRKPGLLDRLRRKKTNE